MLFGAAKPSMKLSCRSCSFSFSKLSVLQATHWVMLDAGRVDLVDDDGHACMRVHPPHDKTSMFEVLRRCDFSSEKQRNLVVVKHPDGTASVFVKGSPEAVQQLVSRQSLPPEFHEVLESYTHQGLRVLALARRRLSQNANDLDIMVRCKGTLMRTPLHWRCVNAMTTLIQWGGRAVYTQAQGGTLVLHIHTCMHFKQSISLAGLP